MITYKIENDKYISFILPGGSANIMDPNVNGDKVTFSPEEIIELERAIHNAKFDWCKKFKCSFDNPMCH
jgi:hypothetical protein